MAALTGQAYSTSASASLQQNALYRMTSGGSVGSYTGGHGFDVHSTVVLVIQLSVGQTSFNAWFVAVGAGSAVWLGQM